MADRYEKWDRTVSDPGDASGRSTGNISPEAGSDTVCAISTPPGRGGIGIIRVSGPDAEKLLMRIFRPVRKGPLEDHRLTYGHIVDPVSGAVVDEVLAVFMKGPHTYTAEDTAEIDGHGGRVPLKRTLALLVREGARLAEPGEFTERAFLNGRLDLSQAEAVMDIISARTDRSLSAAVTQLSGGLSGRVRAIRKDLLDLRVELAVNIDYPDEDIEVLTYEKLSKGFSEAASGLARLSASGRTGRILRDGLRVVILGRPNVGKSSLMNSLLRSSRAIVTDIPGTTRDTIEESLDLQGIPVVLTDTAGIRDTEDQVEALGVSRSRESVRSADLTLFLLDGAEGMTEEDRVIARELAPEKTIVLINKEDKGNQVSEKELETILPGVQVLIGSVKNGTGMDDLENAIVRFALGREGYAAAGKSPESAMENDPVVVTNVRHQALLREARERVEDALRLVSERAPFEVIDLDAEEAYLDLGLIVGEEVSDDLLKEVFSRFCLGK